MYCAFPLFKPYVSCSWLNLLTYFTLSTQWREPMGNCSRKNNERLFASVYLSFQFSKYTPYLTAYRIYYYSPKIPSSSHLLESMVLLHCHMLLVGSCYSNMMLTIMCYKTLQLADTKDIFRCFLTE